MEYNFSRTLARIGSLLIVVGLILPWYKLDFSAFAQSFGISPVLLKQAGLPTGQNIKAWDDGHTVVFVLGAFALLAMTQIPFASPSMVGSFFMVAGLAGVVLIGYKIVTPPSHELLTQLNLKLKPMPGIFVSLAGMAAIAFAGFEQSKQGSSTRAAAGSVGSDWMTTQQAPSAHPTAQPAVANGYQAPTPGVPQTEAQRIAGPRVIPPDPFAVKPPTFSP